MSRNKFGELVRKYVIDRSGDAERRVLGQLPGNYVGMNVYEALNTMLNILSDKDDMGIEGATDKVANVTGINKSQAEEIVCAHKKYKEKTFPKDCCTLPEYEDFRKKVSDICESLPSFRRYFVTKTNECIDVIVREIDYRINCYHNLYGSSLDGMHKAIKDLERYICKINADAGSYLSSDEVAKYVGPLVLYHPYYGNHKNVTACKKLAKKENVMNSSKKTRRHDKYRFFINKPCIDYNDIKRVLEEAEKEGYDLVVVNNTNNLNPHSLVYATEKVFKIIGNVFSDIKLPSYHYNNRKGWVYVDTKKTIAELFEAVKKAEKNRVKVEVERYRVTV